MYVKIIFNPCEICVNTIYNLSQIPILAQIHVKCVLNPFEMDHFLVVLVAIEETEFPSQMHSYLFYLTSNQAFIVHSHSKLFNKS
jgi:hypothetical protein